MTNEHYNKLLERYNVLEASYIAAKQKLAEKDNNFEMSPKQYMYLWSKVRPFLRGKPDVAMYFKTLDDLIRGISNEEQRHAVFVVGMAVMGFVESADKLGVSLDDEWKKIKECKANEQLQT